MTRPERMQHKLLLRRLSRHWTTISAARFLEVLLPRLTSTDAHVRAVAEATLAAAIAGRRADWGYGGRVVSRSPDLVASFVKIDGHEITLMEHGGLEEDQVSALETTEQDLIGLSRAAVQQLARPAPALDHPAVPDIASLLLLDEVQAASPVDRTAAAPKRVTAASAMIDTLTGAPHGPTAAAPPAAA